MDKHSEETASISSEADHEFSVDGIRRIKLTASQKIISRKRQEWKNFISTLPPYPDTYKGKGIVICAGGLPYFTCAWVNIKMLRKNGCNLPVEMWHQEGELNDETIDELKKLNVTCRNFSDYSEEKISNGYQLKPVAILHSSFKEILFLDADNNCLKDPAFLFRDAFYEDNGAVFWPDYWKTEKANPIWQVVDSTEFNIPEQESGQLLINKERCWREINLCLFFNFDPFYYKILWGDKDTFKFSWLALRSPFHMVEKAVGAVGFQEQDFGFGSVAMLQHDYAGEPIFIHSNLLKWNERTSNKLFWREIRRLDPASKIKIEMKYHPHFHKYFLSIEGDTEPITENHPIARLERDCLNELKELKNSGFYQNLIKSVE